MQVRSSSSLPVLRHRTWLVRSSNARYRRIASQSPFGFSASRRGLLSQSPPPGPEVDCQQRSRALFGPARLSAQDCEVMLPPSLPGTAGTSPRRSHARSHQGGSRSARCGARGPCPLCPLRQLRSANTVGPSQNPPAWSLQSPRPSGDVRRYGARGGRRGGDR